MQILSTEKRLQANQKHMEYDISESTVWLEKWLTKYSYDNPTVFLEQIEFYTNYLKDRIK